MGNGQGHSVARQHWDLDFLFQCCLFFFTLSEFVQFYTLVHVCFTRERNQRFINFHRLVMAEDLDARVSLLQERLRSMRGESIPSLYKGSQTPKTPNEAVDDLSIASPAVIPPPAQAPQQLYDDSLRSPKRPQQSSPWSEVGRQTLRAEDEEMNKMINRQRSVATSLENRLADVQLRLQSTNSAVNQYDSELNRTKRQRDVFAADGHRALDDAERRLLSVERADAQLQGNVADLTAQKLALTRQLEETRLAIRKAEVRLSEIVNEQSQLEGKLREQLASLREHNRRGDEENSQFNALKRRLESRIQEVSEENKQQTDRLRKLEAQYSAQQNQWRENEVSLQKNFDEAQSLVHETQLRLQTLELELEEREREIGQQKQLRERRQEELLSIRAAEKERDIERHREETRQREEQIRKEREESILLLRAQLEELHSQIERKRRARDAQKEATDEMKKQLSQLHVALEEKRILAKECEALESQVAELKSALKEQRDEELSLEGQVTEAQEKLTSLQNQSRKLQQRLDEERRLKQMIADTARELTDAELHHAEEMNMLEKQENALLTKQREFQLQLQSVEHNIERDNKDHAIELDALSRRITSIRQDVLEKEAQLNNLIGENAMKQNTIAQYEEEKRRLEREQMARKASAAQAARAALSELAV